MLPDGRPRETLSKEESSSPETGSGAFFLKISSMCLRILSLSSLLLSIE
jgi:hypothetical protein